MDLSGAFEAERPQLLGLATRVLADHVEAEDAVRQAWLRLHATDADIVSLPAWLTTVTAPGLAGRWPGASCRPGARRLSR